MLNLFDEGDRHAILRRLDALQPSSPRQWGKMTVDQMLAHCAIALDVPCGDVVKKQALIGRLAAPLVKRNVLGEKPFSRNAPTDPQYRVTDSRDFTRERARLVTLIDRFATRGAPGVNGIVHGFFGRLSGDQWGRLMYKHLDHHLRQFGA